MTVMLLLGGCGVLEGARSTARCDFRPDGDSECQEFRVLGPDIVTLSATCMSLNGDWAREPCPREGILAGCESIDPSDPWDVTRWIYEGYEDHIVTVADAEAECSESEEVPVPPPES